MTRLSQEVDRLAHELAWSLWAELGVDGMLRRDDWQAIDLEPLIIFTAYLGDTDNRLRASTIDWCITNARFVSAFRLRHLAARASPRTRTAFGRYAAPVRAHSKAPGPGEGDPLTLFHPEHLGSPDLRRPSLIQLRLRALVGVSARAEVLKLMLADPDRPQAASALSEDAAYGKGSVAQALDMLTMAGIVQVQPDANRLLYRLSRPAELAQGLLERIHPDIRRLGIADHVPHATGPASVAELEHWALDFLAEQTGHVRPAKASREISYVIHHLSFGGWLGTVNVAGREPQPFGPEQGEEEAPGAPLLVQLMFRDVLARSQRGGLPAEADEALMQVISQEFAEELVRPMRVGQEATFTAEFLRRWYENRRQRVGATA